ncbi:unnamed protein product [Leuciscus chuanchicus]
MAMYHSAALSHFRQYLERLLALAEVPEDELNPLTDNWISRWFGMDCATIVIALRRGTCGPMRSVWAESSMLDLCISLPA